MRLSEAVAKVAKLDWVQKHIEMQTWFEQVVPVFRGTGVPVHSVLSLLAEGARHSEVYSEYPKLTREHLRAGLTMAAELLLLVSTEKMDET